MSRAEYVARLEHLLEVQGQIIDAYLAQNMGERYAYLLLATPRAEPSLREARAVSHVTNMRPALAEHIALAFAERVKHLDAASLLDGLAPEPILGGFGDAR